MTGAHRGDDGASRRADHATAMANPHDVAQARSRLPWWAQALGLAGFIFLVLAAAIYAVGGHWRRSTFVLGVAMVWLAALRFTCDDSVIGLFSVRSRRFDVAFSLLVGALTMYLSVSVDALGS